MNCEIKPRVVRMIKNSIVGDATSYVIYKDKVFIPFNAFDKEAKIQTLEQSQATARRIIKKIHEEFEAEKFGNSVSIDSTYKDGTMIHIHPTNKLMQALELKDKLEIERRQRESLYNNVVLKERSMGIDEFGDSNTSLLSLSNIVHVSKKINNPYFKDTPKKSSVSMLVQISKSTHPLNKLAQQLLPYAKHNNISISLVDEFTERGLNKIREDNRKVSGVYYPNTSEYKHVKNSIEISKDWENRDGFVEVILHEIIHSLSNYIISTNLEVKEDFRKYYEHALKVITKEERKNPKLDYALTSLDEFIAGIFTNPAFMHKLMNLPAPHLFDSKYKNMFHEIIEYILRLFKINSRDTFYEEAFNIATNILEYQKDYYNNQEYETEDHLLNLTKEVTSSEETVSSLMQKGLSKEAAEHKIKYNC